jgi:hypothetical protein
VIRFRSGKYALPAVLWLAACATPVPRGDQTPDFGFPAVGTIGVISSISPPDVDTRHLPWAPDNAVEGGIGGAAAGGAYLAYFFCLPPSPFVLACLVAAGAGTAIGAAAGTEAASRADEVKAAESAVHAGGANVTMQGVLRERVLKTAAMRGHPSLVDLGDGDSGTATSLPQTEHVTKDVDHVLELAVVQITVGSTGDDRLGVTMHAVSRLVRTADGSVRRPRSHYYVGPSIALEDWKADGSRRLQDSLDAGLDALARDILAE